MHPDELGAGRVRVAEAAKDFWQIRRLTVRYLHKSGRTVHLESTASKVPSGAGDGTWELLAVSRDVTERLEGRVTPGRERGSTEADPGQPAGRLLPGRHRGPAHFRQSLAARMFGYAAVGEMMGAPAAILCRPEERARLLEEVRRSDRVTDWVMRGREEGWDDLLGVHERTDSSRPRRHGGRHGGPRPGHQRARPRGGADTAPLGRCRRGSDEHHRRRFRAEDAVRERERGGRPRRLSGRVAAPAFDGHPRGGSEAPGLPAARGHPGCRRGRRSRAATRAATAHPTRFSCTRRSWSGRRIRRCWPSSRT